MIAATVQETDLAGHAQNPVRYANRIEMVDQYLPEILRKMTDQDLLMISADHGMTLRSAITNTHGKNVFAGLSQKLSPQISGKENAIRHCCNFC